MNTLDASKSSCYIYSGIHDEKDGWVMNTLDAPEFVKCIL